MKIFDCFTFFNEVELLELRLMVLQDVVDHFVIVEANRSHTGKPKEFILTNGRERYGSLWDKVIYVQVTDLPIYNQGDIWIPENFQRNCILRGLAGGVATPGDVIIVSDLDEIPKPESIRKHLNDTGWIVFQQSLYYYHVNCLQNQIWDGPIMAKYGTFGQPQALRNEARSLVPGVRVPREADGGWHYSFMGGASKILEKVANIAESHLIIDQVGSKEEIEEKILTQKDLWGRTEALAQKQIVDIQETADPHLWKFLEKYPSFYFGELPHKEG